MDMIERDGARIVILIFNIMRDIKFRAWSNYDKCWISAFCIHETWLFSDLINASIKNGTPVADCHWKELNPNSNDIETWIVLMQFTWLRDKNGKEIYEGDIVKYSIDWWYWEWALEIKKEVWYEKWHFYPFLHWREEFHQKTYPEFCEVIWNKYENPELL